MIFHVMNEIGRECDEAKTVVHCLGDAAPAGLASPFEGARSNQLVE